MDLTPTARAAKLSEECMVEPLAWGGAGAHLKCIEFVAVFVDQHSKVLTLVEGGGQNFVLCDNYKYHVQADAGAWKMGAGIDDGWSEHGKWAREDGWKKLLVTWHYKGHKGQAKEHIYVKKKYCQLWNLVEFDGASVLPFDAHGRPARNFHFLVPYVEESPGNVEEPPT